MSCLFCKIVNQEIPADIVYESDTVLAFRDIDPKAPTHVLIIPKTHIQDVMDISQNQLSVMTDITVAIQQIVTDLNLESDGFRVVNNTGEGGGQTVFHIHFHLLGGRTLNWPPG